MGDPLRLYGLNALVLNAADGIGEAIARTLIKHGATVVAVDTRNSGVEQQFANLKSITGKSAALTDPDSLTAAIAEAAKDLGGIDILVNDFPLHPAAPLERVDDQLENLLQSRSLLIMAACRAALPFLKKSPQGRIINIGCLRSFFSQDGEPARAHAEQDLARLTHELALENAGSSINVNYIQPGAVMTPQSRDVFRKDKALRDYCMQSSATGRLGEALDVAKVALFLASDDAGYVSGTGIAVDGGRAKPA